MGKSPTGPCMQLSVSPLTASATSSGCGSERWRGRQVLVAGAHRDQESNRGVEDACIVVCDGLKGLPEAIEATWPLAIVQTSCAAPDPQHVPPRQPRRLGQDSPRSAPPVYTAVNEADAAARLDEFHTFWGDKYPAIRTLWKNAWAEFVPFLDYSPEIRRVIYSTNAIWSR